MPTPILSTAPVKVLAAFPRAILDAFDHAAWLTDSTGRIVVLNKQAENLAADGCRLLAACIDKPLHHEGKTFEVQRRELHPDGWCLNELRLTEDEACRKLRVATNRLADFLDQPQRSAAMVTATK